MQLATTANRPPYADRAAVRQSLTYIAGGIAPHAVTTRATYTVPTGKRAVVQGGSIVAYRDAAPGVSADVTALIDIALVRYLAGIQTNAAVGQDFPPLASAAAVDVLAGEAVRIQTQDNSTGGSNLYSVGVHILEYAP